MKVICIDASRHSDCVIFYPGFLKEGEIYIVIEETVGRNKFNQFVPAYILEGQPIAGCYPKSRFAPLSSIDETEFERNYNLVTLPSNY